MHDPSDPVSLLSELELRRDAFVRLMERSVLQHVQAGYLEEIAKISEKIEHVAAAVAAEAEFTGPLVEIELGDDDDDLLLDDSVVIELLDHDPEEEGVEVELVTFRDEDMTRVRTTYPYPVVEDRFRMPPL